MSFKDSGLDLEEYFGCSDLHATRPRWVARPSIHTEYPTKEELSQYKGKLEDFYAYKENDAAWLVKNQEKIDYRSTEFIFYFYEHVGIPFNHPKANKLFSKCWKEEHSGGYSEVLNVGLDLVELIL